jgi:hypothetical protein
MRRAVRVAPFAETVISMGRGRRLGGSPCAQQQLLNFLNLLNLVYIACLRRGNV